MSLLKSVFTGRGKMVILAIVAGSVLGALYRVFPYQMELIFLDPKHFRVLGSVFISMIKMVVAPLVLCGVITAIVSDGKTGVGKLMFHSMITFCAMTVFAVLVGILFASYFKPGANITLEQRESIISTVDSLGVDQLASYQIGSKATSSLQDFVLGFVPKNIFDALVRDNFLQLVFFGIIFALAALNTPESVRKPCLDGVRIFTEITHKMSSIAIRMAPLAIFGIVFMLIGTQSTILLTALLKLVLTTYGAVIFLVYGCYSLILLIFRLNPLKFFSKVFHCQINGFIAASSASVLPDLIKTSINKLGVPDSRAGFILPFGSVINMNGSAIHLTCFTLFVAQIHGVDFALVQYLTLAVLATCGAMGSAPVPGASLFLLAGILETMDLPVGMLAVAISIDRILDMARTFTNVGGDGLSGVLIARMRGELDTKVYNAK